jgi:hypothetical protein
MNFVKCLVTVAFVSALLVGCTSGTSTCASTGTAEAQPVNTETQPVNTETQPPATTTIPANAEPTEVAAEVAACPPTSGCPCQAHGQWEDTETRVN